MEARQRTLNEVLTEEIRYEIPPYQRPYSWEAEHVEQLLEDAWEAYTIAKADKTQGHEYFIGSLITIELEKGERYEVVDGQQRLTTLNLIFARLRDAVSEPARTALGARVLPQDPLTQEKAKPRLTLRKSDQAFFQRHILNSEPVPKDILQKIARERDAPKQRILENAAVIDAFIAMHDETTLRDFAKYLLSKVYVVFVTTNSLDSAYRLFNVLNARGLSLSSADLIKNMLFAKIADSADHDRSKELEELWLELEEMIGVRGLDQFLAHHRLSATSLRATKTLHEEFKPLIADADSAFVFLDELLASARNYRRILKEDFETAASLRSVRALRRAKYDDWVPALMAFLNSPFDEMEEEEFIASLEKITYQNWIRRLGRTARATVYAQLISALIGRRRRRSETSLRAIFQSHASDDEFRALLDSDIYGKPFTQAVLMRLEEADQDDSVTKAFSGLISIEHVLPQSIQSDGWKAIFSEEQHRLWLHRLGNLTLLSGRKNRQAQNYEFERKKTIYAKQNAKVSFDLTKSVLAEAEWTPAVLEARQKDLLGKAWILWSLGDASSDLAST